MLPPKDDLRRRRWIWQALADLFLDRKTDDVVLPNIARTAAECGYSFKELEAIYRNEVVPAVGFSVTPTARVWGFFDTNWLEDRILKRNPLEYWAIRLTVVPLLTLLFFGYWRRIKKLLAEESQRVELAKTNPGWQPCCADEAPAYYWGTAEIE